MSETQKETNLFIFNIKNYELKFKIIHDIKRNKCKKYVLAQL